MNRSIIQTRSKSDKIKEATELDEEDSWTGVSDLRSEHYPLSTTSAVSPEAEVPADPMALLQNAMATMITSMNQERKTGCQQQLNMPRKRSREMTSL